MAVIGKLIATLGLDLDKIEQDTKKATKKLKAFAANVKGIMAKVGKAMMVVKGVMLAVGAATGAFLVGIASNIDRVTKASEQLGLTTNELNRLEHAANLSGVKIEDLGMAVRLLSKNMQDMASGAASPAVKTFEALGIKVKDAEGNLRSNMSVMNELADKFRRMEDGAGKTALAMNLFGESGAKLIPLLNAGSEGIKTMGDEAERLGLTFSSKASKEAVRFQDNVAKLKASFTGFLNLLGERLFPIFSSVAEAMNDQGKRSASLQLTIDALTLAFKALLTAGVLVYNAFEAMGVVVQKVSKAIGEVVDGEFSKAYSTMKDGVTDVKEVMSKNAQTIKDIWLETASSTATVSEEMVKKSAAPILAVTTQFQEQQKLQAESQAKLNAAMAEGKRIYEETRTPMEAIIDKQRRLSELLQMGAIDADTFGRAMKMASAVSANNMDALASQVSTALGVIFKDSKAAAIASALINTYQGITKALSTYPPPVAQAMAAIQAAMGFAQVAAIRNTSESSSGAASSATATGAAAGAGAAAGGAGGAGALIVEGLNPSDFFRGDTVRNLIDEIIDYQEQGGNIIVQ